MKTEEAVKQAKIIGWARFIVDGEVMVVCKQSELDALIEQQCKIAVKDHTASRSKS